MYFTELEKKKKYHYDMNEVVVGSIEEKTKSD